MRVMLAGAAVVIAAAAIFDVSGQRWAMLVLCIGAVLSAEVTNTAIERLADQIEPRFDTNIRDIKDVAAGAVLIIAGLAAIVAIIVFWPYVND